MAAVRSNKKSIFVSWILNIRWGRVLFCAVLYTVVSTIIRQVEAVLTMKYYLMPQYFGVWSRIMMPSHGPPPPEFFITSTVFSICTGISLCMIYYYLKPMLPSDERIRILYFADILIGTSFIFFTIPSYLLFNLPLGLLISWFISSFVILVSASFIIVKILK